MILKKMIRSEAFNLKHLLQKQNYFILVKVNTMKKIGYDFSNSSHTYSYLESKSQFSGKKSMSILCYMLLFENEKLRIWKYISFEIILFLIQKIN